MNQYDQLTLTLSIIGTVIIGACFLASLTGLLGSVPAVVFPLGVVMLFAAMFVFFATEGDAA